jgi:DNA-binding NarL/FixJ family response regulator
MPGMTGIDLLKWLSSNNKKFRANVFSSREDDSVRRDALAHGAACFLVKPFGSDDLMLAMKAVIEN